MNRAALEALGLTIYTQEGPPKRFVVQPVCIAPACHASHRMLKVIVGDEETDEAALGRLLAMAQDCLT